MKSDTSKELYRWESGEELRDTGQEGGVVEAGSVIIGMAYIDTDPARSEQATQVAGHMMLLVVMQTRLLRLDANTLQILDCVDLSGSLVAGWVELQFPQY